jgi:hypothetical protein
MKIKREMLEEAASAGMLKYSQIDNLLVFLVQQELKKNRESSVMRTASARQYSLFGMLALIAAAVFAVEAVSALGVGALMWFAVLYGLCAVGVAHWCAQRDLRFPAALFSVIAIVLAGAAVFALQAMQGLWNGGLNVSLAGIDERWMVIQAAALAMSLILLGWLRLPFLMLPSAFIAWLMGMDAILGNLAWRISPQALALAAALTLGCLALLATGLWSWRSGPALVFRLSEMLPQDMQKRLRLRIA